MAEVSSCTSKPAIFNTRISVDINLLESTQRLKKRVLRIRHHREQRLRLLLLPRQLAEHTLRHLLIVALQ